MLANLSIQRRDLAWATALIVLVAAVWVNQGNRADAGVIPSGAGIDVAYVATGANFPDSLGVGPGAGINSAPIIILPTNPPIPAASESELIRLDPKKVIIVGGTAVISTAMEAELSKTLPSATIERIAGANRYETNAMFSAATFPVEGWASIPAAAFQGGEPAVDDVNLVVSEIYNNTTGFLHAAIQLPHGAEILELKVSGEDNHASLDVAVTLWRVNLSGGAEQLAGVASSGQPAAFVESSTSIVAGKEKVDNGQFHYAVLVQNASDAIGTNLHGIMVRYRLGSQ